MGVKLQSSLGGSVEIAAPATASNYTLTAPATSSTIDTLARPGNVLQVVNSSSSATVGSTSSTYVSTGLSATITPTSATNKILVICCYNYYMGSLGTVGSVFRLDRDTTPIGYADVYRESSGQYKAAQTSIITYDTPSTTSATVYSLKFNRYAGVDGISVNSGNGGVALTITLTLMEIAG